MTTTTTANQVIISPTGSVKRCIIWLHGLGADGHDFVDVVPMLTLPKDMGLRFVFPHAPIQSVTLNGGMHMRAWFDMKNLSGSAITADPAGVMRARNQVNDLIAEQVTSGILPDHIILAGFSQGGTVALDCGLHYPEKLAGILGLSTYLPPQALTTKSANQTTPILLMHGRDDVVLPITLGEQTRNGLQQAGFNVSWHDYPMGHSLCPQQIADISAWLQQVLEN